MFSRGVALFNRLLCGFAVIIAALSATQAWAQSVQWPEFGPKRNILQLNGMTNAVPDFVGPVDGSAELTIFTEGNHFPVLLPLTLEAFPAWCRSTGECKLDPAKILIVTLPQPMIVDILIKGGVRLGNAVIPVGRDARVFPSFVMGGRDPLGRLAEAGIVENKARVFARHRGLGLLVRQNLTGVNELNGFRSDVRRLVIASEAEAGARKQYRVTLDALIGGDAASEIMSREVRTFTGRLGIQHRDVPYALLSDLADGGIIFSHLAAFYAKRYPERLRYIAVPEAAAFGQEIAIARTSTKQGPAARAFLRYFMETARTAYPDGGFAAPTSFPYGKELDLASR